MVHMQRILRGSRSKAHVLYADIREEGGRNTLPRLCELVRAAYRDAGLQFIVLRSRKGCYIGCYATHTSNNPQLNSILKSAWFLEQQQPTLFLQRTYETLKVGLPYRHRVMPSIWQRHVLSVGSTL